MTEFSKEQLKAVIKYAEAQKFFQHSFTSYTCRRGAPARRHREMAIIWAKETYEQGKALGLADKDIDYLVMLYVEDHKLKEAV